MKKFTADSFSAIGELNQDYAPPKIATKTKINPDYCPKLNRGAQIDLYESEAKNILAWSEKGSGKTFVCIHKLVKHCVNNKNALAVILVPTKSMANKGGAWDELQDVVLPEWRKNANVEYTEVRQDEQKNVFIWIANKYGTWSQVFLISCPYGSQLKDRMPGFAISYAFVDELDKCDSEEYLRAVAAQIGRRRGIPGKEQQYIAACNPKGPSSWIYQRWFEDAYDAKTGEWDPLFKQIYLPVKDNAKNLPEGYFENLSALYKGDAIELARLIGGQWVDKPSGEALFADVYLVSVHVWPLNDNGHPHPKLRIQPNPDYPVLMGIDSGQTHHSFSLLQQLPVDGRLKYIAFDEVVIIKKKLTYGRIMPIIMRQLKFWIDLVGMMALVSVSDNSAFNVWRPNSAAGSFDFQDMEREWNTRNEKMGVPQLKIKPCPKFNDSVAARIRCLQNALADEKLVISSGCVHHQNMLRLLESEKQKEGKDFDPELSMKPRRSRHLHVFDSLTYPMLMGALKPHALAPQREGTQKLIRVA